MNEDAFQALLSSLMHPPLTCAPIYARITEDLNAAVVLQSLLSWGADRNTPKQEGWFSVPPTAWETDAYVTPVIARKGTEWLESLGLIETKIALEGKELKTWYRINLDALTRAFEATAEAEGGRP